MPRKTNICTHTHTHTNMLAHTLEKERGRERERETERNDYWRSVNVCVFRVVLCFNAFVMKML